MIKYSKKNHACYDTGFNYPDLPDDLIEINSEEHEMFMGNGIVIGYKLKMGVYPFELEKIEVDYSYLAKTTRDNAVNKDITVHDSEWQVFNDAEDIRKVISDAETIGASEDESTMFRLADNSWRKTTLSELREVLKSHVERKKKVWNSFGNWDAGDKLDPFEFK